MKKKVIIACTRRRVSEYIKEQLEELLGEYADIGMMLINQESACRIRCDLVIAISEEMAKQVAPMLMSDTEIIVLHLTIQRSMYDRLKAASGEKKAIVINNTQELALETVALLYALDMKNIELFPYYPGCTENYSDIKLAITPNEFPIIPRHIERVIDIGERCLDPLTLIEVFSRLDCLNPVAIEKIFTYGRKVISINRGITELTRYGHDFGFSEQQFVEGFSEAVLILDDEKKVSLLNSAAQELFNEPYIYLIHRDICDLIPETGIPKGRVKAHLSNAPVMINGKKYLMTWNFFSDKMEGSSALILKSFEEMRNLYARYGSERVRKAELKYNFDDIIGSSEAMRRMKEKARKFAETDFPILIQGESGTGKELLAQAIHQASGRKEEPFIAFNCASLTDSLLESELFGYHEGAFTGASRKGKPGIFEMASGGTLFMDEIGDVSLNLQAKILRVLQEQEVVRVGGSQVIPVDVRIISATNQDLLSFVKEKRFRLDLYYRLNTLILQTVPLRNRANDIYDMLPWFFRKNHIRKNIHEDAMKFMLNYSWPGNVREFQNCISYLSIVEHDTIRVEDFPEYMLSEKPAVRLQAHSEMSVESEILTELYGLRLKGEKTGRKKLADNLQMKGIPLTEAEIRVYLERLQEKEYVSIHKGRGGTQITQKGIHSIMKGSGKI
ncbi:sigma 54-interacting transcriptional regulator [[Clostridium] symbiosum]|uniref:sigma-54 interaction domain-containing protein n=1 Tax=Clostridium symbiosum TaxID=1512 RepID=UPI001D07C0D9|nr:sigma 54-interacting transcriptional regulator [[Clostridium] symbiosum]MCB6609561.1 sigma 54-interacting transcriptional regulator [[Clostridium] symbiosum]MCB6931505.1 sigma 54-interacting transcriptional regulator [[Clostridium] symbiosum]